MTNDFKVALACLMEKHSIESIECAQEYEMYISTFGIVEFFDEPMTPHGLRKSAGQCACRDCRDEETRPYYMSLDGV